METESLEALERDLDAVSRRLAAERTWDPSAWRVRWLLQEPLIELVWTLALIAASLWLGLRNGHSWMVAAALVLAVLPRQVEKLRERRAELASAAEGDLFELYRSSLERRFGSLLFGIFFDLAIVFGSLLFALIMPDPRALLALATIFAARAAYTGFVGIPRTLRDSRAVSPVREPDDDDDDDDGTLAGFVLVLIGWAVLLFVSFGAPLVILVSVALALKAEDPRGPWTLAAGMTVAWIAVVAWRVLDQDEDDEGADDETKSGTGGDRA